MKALKTKYIVTNKNNVDTMNTLSPRFGEALIYANRVHQDHHRKGTTIPYIAHLLAVASIVIENGGNEDEAIAALLHDAVEDRGGRSRLHEITEKFGSAVADIVEGCSDTLDEDKEHWSERKKTYLEHLQHASQSVLLVSLADKVPNARSVLRDYKEIGENLWSRFTGGKEGTLWYYSELADIFLRCGHKQLAEELNSIVNELKVIERTRCNL